MKPSSFLAVGAKHTLFRFLDFLLFSVGFLFNFFSFGGEGRLCAVVWCWVCIPWSEGDASSGGEGGDICLKKGGERRGARL